MKKSKSALQKRLLVLFNSESSSSFGNKEIIRKLNLKPSDAKRLSHALKDLQRNDLISRSSAGCWKSSDGSELNRAKVDMLSSGNGAILRDENDLHEYFAPKRHLNGAIDGDIVLYRRLPETFRRRSAVKLCKKKRRPASVIAVESHTRETMTGTLLRHGSKHFILCDDERVEIVIEDCRIDGRSASDLVGRVVVVELTPPSPLKIQAGPRGNIVEDLGNPSDPGVDIATIARRHGIDGGFSEEVESQVATARKSVSQQALKSRTDLRKMRSFTIDPDDARDFDDAVSVSLDDAGNYHLYVHIADVAHYVEVDTEVDREALARGNSTYLVDRVLPMLPEHLTCDVCSLRPDVASLTRTVKMIFDPTGALLSSDTFRSVIHSNARLTYDQVQSYYDGVSDHGIPKILLSDLKASRKLARVLRAKRAAEGSLEFSVPEAKCILDADGRCVDVVLKGGTEACNMIEEFMLAANRVVAASLKQADKPAIYRVHADPDGEDWSDMLEELKVLGVSPLPHSFSDLNHALEQISGSSASHAFNVRILRTMKKAMYSTSSSPHFGLGFDCYTHFTSPIRRYADLVVHRLLDAIENESTETWPSEDRLESIAAQCSAAEVRSQNAERESVDQKRISFYKGLLDKGENGPFQGIVVEVLQKGILVELLGTLQSGLIPFADMRDDHYQSVKRGMIAKGRRTGKQIKVGQLFKVYISRIDSKRSLIDFRL